jgi:hypothetical protein
VSNRVCGNRDEMVVEYRAAHVTVRVSAKGVRLQAGLEVVG